MSEEVKEEQNFLFRHNRIRRFSVAGFEFKNNELRLTSVEERDRFIEVVKGLPRIESVDIVEVNERARAAAESSVVSSTVVRDAFKADDILTAKDRQAIQTSLAGGAGGNNLAPNPGAPQGFNGLIK